MSWKLKGSYIETCSCDLICPCNASLDHGAVYDYWRVGVFIDDQATDEQADKLAAVFSGQLGGPMGALGPLVGEMLGVERAAFEVQDDGTRHSVRIGDAIDFEIEDIVPFGVETGQPVRLVGMFHPVASELTVAEAKRSRINAFGIQYQGKPGLSTSEFSWAA